MGECNKVFVNYTNHPCIKWSKEQRDSALEYGEIVDIPFPNVGPHLSCGEVYSLAYSESKKIADLKPSMVLVQGEMTLVFALVRQLLVRGVDCVAATTERVVRETQNPDGTTSKTATFQFVNFREYIL